MFSTLIIIVLIIAMLGSLFSAMYYMIKDKGRGTRTVKALSWRIGIWVVLFAVLLIGVKSGLIEPSMSVTPPAYKID